MLDRDEAYSYNIMDTVVKKVLPIIVNAPQYYNTNPYCCWVEMYILIDIRYYVRRLVDDNKMYTMTMQ